MEEIKEELNKIQKILIEKFNPLAIILFGSFARGTQNLESDIDIAIVGNIELEDRLYIEGILEEKLNRSIDLVNIEELPKNIQLQIVSRNKKIIFKD